MIDRRPTQTAALESEQMKRGFRGHRDEVLAWLKSTPHMQFTEIDYPTLVRESLPQISRLIDFLGIARNPAHLRFRGVQAVPPQAHEPPDLTEQFRLALLSEP